jgi:two-component system KDP operon response regulator KdpE
LAQDIESWFRRYRYEIDCATDMSEAVTVARRHTPSMVLVDRRQRGWEALRGEPSLLWVPMMTLVPAGMAGHQDALLDLDRGMDGYHVCEDGFRLLVARVRALMRRAAFSAHGQPICRAGDIELDSERFEVTVAGQVVAFPLIQFRILHLLMQSPGRVYRTREIVDHVWGPGYSIGRHTLAVHMFRIRKLLGAQAAQQGSIITVRNVGYKFGPVRPSGDLVVVKSPSPLQRGRMGCRRYPRRLRISRSGRPGGAVRGASDALSVSPCGPSRANCTVS